MYGGTPHRPEQRQYLEGLSPRVRGNRGQKGHLYLRSGSIPACTGEPQGPQNPSLTEKVYPRVYGGTESALRTTGTVAGLSPRVRGNPSAGVDADSQERSIPACTGEPWAPATRPGGTTVYPRVYGEPSSPPPHTPHSKVYPRVYGGTRGTPPKVCSFYGLSPRVRGTRGYYGKVIDYCGLSPRVRGNHPFAVCERR